MYSLFNYINDSVNGITAIDRIVNEQLAEIDNDIICEALVSNMLRQIAQQLNDFAEYNAKLKTRNAWNYSGSQNRTTHTFAYIFSGYQSYDGASRIEWSKVTDSDFVEYDISDTADEKKKKKAYVIIKKALTVNNKNVVIIFYNNTKKEYTYVMLPYGDTYSLLNPNDNVSYKKTTFAGGEKLVARGARGNTIDMKKSDKFDYVTGSSDKMYVLEITDEMREKVSKLRMDRNESQKGMILQDPESLQEYARQNIKRYKEIIAKNKIERINNTELIDKVKEVLDRANDVINKFAKDTIKYADKEIDVNTLMKLIYDVGTFSAPSQKRTNGLLRVFANYTNRLARVKDTMKSDYKEGGWNSRNSRLSSLEDAEKELKNTIDIVEKHIDALGIE